MAVLRAGLLLTCLLAAVVVAVVAVRVCRPGGRVANAVGRIFCRTVLRLLRVRVTLSGTAPVGGAGVLLVANHVSWIDPLVLLAITPVAVLAKREVGSWPIIGTLARWQATVFVDRRRRRGIPEVNRALADRLGHGCNLLLFPEGTTHDGRHRGRFLTSHLACLAGVLAAEPGRRDAAAQVAALAYSDRAAAWIGDATLLPHLWSILRRPGMTCHVAFGPVRPVARGSSRKVLGQSLAAEVESLLIEAMPARRHIPLQSADAATGLIVTRA